MKRLFKFLLVLIFAIAITGCEGIERVDNKKEAKKEKMDYLVLVNKHNKLPSYWEKVVELEKGPILEIRIYLIFLVLFFSFISLSNSEKACLNSLINNLSLP